MNKEDFPIFNNYKNEHNKELVYLDSASSSQTPQIVIDAMTNFYTHIRSNIDRSSHSLGARATETYENTRREVASFLGSEDNQEIIFTGGSTLASNIIFQMFAEKLSLKEGDIIVSSIMEHHSVLVPLLEITKKYKCELKLIPLDGVNLDYKKAEEIIDDKTKLVVVTLASNVLGIINDVNRISDIAHRHNAFVVADGTAYIGHKKIDVKTLGADSLFFSGHKMCGPTGVGVIWMRRDILRFMKPVIFGGGMVAEVFKDEAFYRSDVKVFEAGTQNISGVIGLGESLKYLEKIGLENIFKHTKEITKYLIEKLKEIDGIKIFTEENIEKNIGIVSFAFDGVHPHDVAEILGRNHISVRGGHHCAEPLVKSLGENSLTRISIYLYNTKEDIDILIEGLKEVKKVFHS